VFFDIGANEGIFSIYAACKNKKLQVYCFEPEYSNLALLKENVLENNLSDRVNIFSVGMSDFNGLSQLHIQDTSEGAAAHSESREKIGKTDEGYKVVWREGIGVTTLDQFCEQMNVIPNGIKIDTDGNEVKILKGAKETLKNLKLKHLVIENPHDQGTKGIECEQILIENNFKKVWSDRSKTINEIWERVSN
jgi:FkbM family methyltransferase